MEKSFPPAILILPLLFAGLIFSSHLRQAPDLGGVLGAMFGGFLEYNDMNWNPSGLSIVGLAIYAVAFGRGQFAAKTSDESEVTSTASGTVA